MADDLLSGKMQWRKVQRTHRTVSFSPVISLRSCGSIALSADFIRLARITDATMATLFLSESGAHLGIRFHNDEADADAFKLNRDGGALGKMGRIITARSLIHQSSRLSALVHEDKRCRRWTPVQDADGYWVAQLMPCFEQVLGSSNELARDQSGIYRYRLGSETVYIGRGKIKERTAEPARAEWHFDRIEYSLLNDDAAERRWETYWIDAYRRHSGRLPVYNKIAGVRVESVEAA